MEPNDPNTQQDRGTQPPPKSPPLPGTSSQQAGATGNEKHSEPGAESGSAEGGASELAVEVKKAANAKVKEGTDKAKTTVSSTVGHGAEALGRAADSFRDQGEDTLAQTTTSIASGLSEYAERLEKRSSEDLIQDLARLARQNPTIFVLGSVAIGIALSRFLKASSRSTDGHG
ncbi:MAG: hypothetical protein ABR522_11160 [Marinobacter sp.]